MSPTLVAPSRPLESVRLRWLALGVAVATALLRLPFVSRVLWDHDSVQFALGVERFDLSAHHPHPPGYPLYIGVLKVLSWLAVEPGTAMVGLSVLAGALGAGAMVLLAGRSVAGGEGQLGAGLLAGVLYGTNPMLWFYGELPLLYAVEGGVAVLVALGVHRLATTGLGRWGPLLGLAVLCGVAGGLRPSTLVLLSPLVLYGVSRAALDAHGAGFGWGGILGRLAGGAATGLAVVSAWLVPLVGQAGGLAAYRELSSEHFGALLPQTSILHGAGVGALAHNLEVLVKWGLQGTLAAGAVLVGLWLTRPRAIVPGVRLLGRRLPFLLAWIVPPVAFFALFHVTKAGYTLIHLPGLLLAVVVLVAPALGRWTRAVVASTVVGLLGAGLFLFGADRPETAPRWQEIFRQEWNAGEIRDFGRELETVLAIVRAEPSEETVVVTLELSGTGGAGADGFVYPWHRHLQWSLPEYRVVGLFPDAPGEAFALATGPLEPGAPHEPFAELGRTVPVPAGTERLLFVLSALPGERFPLPPAEVLHRGDDMVVLATPLPAAGAVGPFRLVPSAGRLYNAPSSTEIPAASAASSHPRRNP